MKEYTRAQHEDVHEHYRHKGAEQGRLAHGSCVLRQRRNEIDDAAARNLNQRVATSNVDNN